MLGAAWQRCRVHFLRNVLAKVPKGSAEMVAAAIRTIFAQPDAAAVADQLDSIAEKLGRQFPAVEPCSATPRPTSAPSPPSPRPTGARSGRRTRSSGSTRRSSGAPTSSGIFPNEAAVLRLAGSVLLEVHDEYGEGGVVPAGVWCD